MADVKKQAAENMKEMDKFQTKEKSLCRNTDSQTVDKVPVFAGTFTMSTVFLV